MKPRRAKNEYEKLRDKWYKKLAKEELKKPEEERYIDIEQDEDTLKGYASVLAYRHTHEEIQEKQRYHDMALAFLEQYKFETSRDRIIWEYHTNFLSVRDITESLKKVKIKTNRNSVAQVIRRLKVKMFDMLWAPLKEYHEGANE